jgi:hypothetical protein
LCPPIISAVFAYSGKFIFSKYIVQHIHLDLYIIIVDGCVTGLSLALGAIVTSILLFYSFKCKVVHIADIAGLIKNEKDTNLPNKIWKWLVHEEYIKEEIDYERGKTNKEIKEEFEN